MREVLKVKESFKELDFRTIREEWMNIQLEDGTVIRFKTVLVRVFETGEIDPITGEPKYAVEGQNIVVARAPDELKGEPSDFIPPIQEIVKKKKPTEIKIKGITGDEWNEYELETGKKIRTKPIITKVLRIDGYYDRYGNPLYIVQSQTVATSSPIKHYTRYPTEALSCVSVELITFSPQERESIVPSTDFTGVEDPEYSSNVNTAGVKGTDINENLEKMGLLYLTELILRKDWDSEEDEFWDNY